MSAKLSILIIEDEKNICDFIAAALKNQDYRVFKSYSGMDGLVADHLALPGYFTA